MVDCQDTRWTLTVSEHMLWFWFERCWPSHAYSTHTPICWYWEDFHPSMVCRRQIATFIFPLIYWWVCRPGWWREETRWWWLSMRISIYQRWAICWRLFRTIICMRFLWKKYLIWASWTMEGRYLFLSHFTFGEPLRIFALISSTHTIWTENVISLNYYHNGYEMDTKIGSPTGWRVIQSVIGEVCNRLIHTENIHDHLQGFICCLWWNEYLKKISQLNIVDVRREEFGGWVGVFVHTQCLCFLWGGLMFIVL